MQNILLIHNGAELYGGSKSLLNIVKTLTNNNLSLTVVLPIEGHLVEELRKINIKIIIIPTLPVISIQRLKKIADLISFVREFYISTKILIKIIKQIKPDIIHTNVSTLPSPALAAILTNTKYIWHIREIYDGRQKYLWYFYQLYIYLFSDAIIANSNATLNQFSHIYRHKIYRLYNSLPLDSIILPNKDEINDFKSQYGINSELCVGMIGRINLNRKGQEVFVSSAKIIKEKFPQIKFIIIGEPYPGKEHYLDSLELIINNNSLQNYVLLIGEVKNINLAIELLDIIVIPSTRPESFGNVASEAMSLSKPVIASNIGGVLDQVIDGKTGLLFENNNHFDLAHKIESLLVDSKIRIGYGTAGKELFRDKFSYKIFSKELINIYHRVYNG